MKKLTIHLVFTISLILSGCTTIRSDATELEKSLGITHVCIEENPDVVVKDFVGIVQRGFTSHGISTSVHQPGPAPGNCEFVLKYTANQSWALNAVQMYYAKLDMYQKDVPIGEAVFRIKTQVPFTADSNTEEDLLPLIDKLLINYS